MKKSEKEFVSISNKEVYEEMMQFRLEVREQFEEVKGHLKETNGRVKLTKWIATTALSLILIAIGFLFNHISSNGG